MSQPAHNPAAVPQPPVQAEAIRSALAQVAPHLLPQFDQDRAAATARARAETSATPLRVFAEAWAVEVAIARHPETAARLRELEAAAEEAADPPAALGIAAEISGIRRAAAAEAGLATGSGSSR
ncbi:hypothetical protein KV205_09740 [Streptomyces sp. SKN60]|uniref:hypothetical protein n=1 Tax=Streptomyces sp. SKN60 TaxID=2855506 RepID=UPI0022451464|nr:hypothetical protein [Streptomyces sp. SKN60]MCX2180808.1 hypothetical protein [Streptomyces sp. SKN60]